MIRVKLSTIHRGDKLSSSQRERVHVTATDGQGTSAYAIGSTKAKAVKRARDLMSLHIHALSAADAIAHRPRTVGIPAGYRLAGEDV